MCIQKITFSDSEYPSLYFRGGTPSEGGILIKDGERLSFDTYFNSFDYIKYRNYTRLDGITFRGKILGEGRVKLCVVGACPETVVAEVYSTGDFCFGVSFDSLPEEAFLYPVIEAVGDAVFLFGEYCSDVEREDVSAAIAICTYKREEYLFRNLSILSGISSDSLNKIYVVDNGNTIDSSSITDSKVILVKNPNYGGSAGFTRGIIEAHRAGCSHVILMDDDIVIFPEAIERMLTFLSLLKKEYKNAHLSAAMLPTSAIYIQHEKGALWNGSHIESLNSGLDIRRVDSLVKNLSDGPIMYGAWWCFCLPLSDVDEFGLPLPLFIKFDDVEYGMRTCKNAPIITMSGMAVSHADFDGKYNMHLEYYSVRNQLITLAVHKKMSTVGCIFRLIKVSLKHLLLYRYDAMPIILRAFRDFLSGPEFIKSVDAEKLNFELMQMTPKSVDLSSIEGWKEEYKTLRTEKSSNKIKAAGRFLLLGGHLIPNLFLNKEAAYMPLPSAKNKDAFLRRTTVQYQILGNQGYVFKKSSPRFFASLFRSFKMAMKILFKYRGASRRYREEKDNLTSLDFWEKYLNMKKDED